MPFHSFLSQPIATISADPFLCNFAQQYRFKTLGQLLQYSGPEILAMEGGSEHCLLAVYTVLEQHHCTHLLREDGEEFYTT